MARKLVTKKRGSGPRAPRRHFLKNQARREVAPLNDCSLLSIDFETPLVGLGEDVVRKLVDRFYLDEISARRVLLTVLQDKAVVYDLVNRVENLYYGFNEVED